MQAGRTPAHVLFEVAFDAAVKKREHDAEHAGVRVEAADRDPFNSSCVEEAHLPLAQTVTALLVENEISGKRREQQRRVPTARRTALLFQNATKHRANGIHKAREHPARKAARIRLQPGDELRRRRKRLLHVDDHQCPMRMHGGHDRWIIGAVPIRRKYAMSLTSAHNNRGPHSAKPPSIYPSRNLRARCV